MNDFSINIETLVLDGSQLEPLDAAHLAQRTERALQRLIEQRGPPVGLPGGDVAMIEAPNTNVGTTAGADQKAEELAFALYQALGRMR